MEIALLTYSTRPRGGVVHTLALAEALARAGQHVTVWSLARGGDASFFRPVDHRVTVRLVPFPDVPGEDVGPRILRSIAVLGAAYADARDGYDVVHAQDCITANAVGDCLRTVHHLDTFSTPELAACHEKAIVTPRALVCVSAAVAAEVAEGWGRTATVIPNGVQAGRFEAAAGPAGAPARQRWREQLGGYVLAVGGIEPRKGTLDLVEAMALLNRAEARRGRPATRLVVAGGETLFDYRDYRARVEARAAALGVQPLVLGQVDHEELPALVAAARVLAFPSTREGFGLAAMEALAAGVPLVTRDLPVLREVFGPAAVFAGDPAGLAAALLDAVDEAGRATADGARRQAAGRALARAHSWDTAAQAHLRLYRALG
ncbi:MSMEG_0565 family glycosyltransferase [Modestobacter sp. I12A-02628]|uniref:MSMEG_0565 family glycosyltransferase n=1 Tax=Goekera deserti TaxID=2497753 RepID=A0A7K3WA70_9ACTN|nr:MSMEG_0565 family glycosyltransferase [Goekera deserti]NDI49581.1 MSMEG_0565 family glycosyltransferase [Goekera deserti]NEL53226.1 MSMEG_0565 family glycosyltransferase [Goekera deserti]